VDVPAILEAQRKAAADAFRGKIESYTQTNPKEALRLIEQDKGLFEHKLSADERASLAAKAGETLLAHLKGIKDSWEALAQVRSSRSLPGGVELGDFSAKLDKLEVALRDRCLVLALETATKFGEQGKWADAAQDAAKSLYKLGLPEVDTKALSA